MLRKSSLWTIALGVPLAAVAWGGTFGTVIPIGGAAADLALDEGRGVLYIANFTANRIDVMTLANNTIQTSIHVAAQPSSLSLSPDGHYLLVAHYGNFVAPGSPNNSLTLIDLTSKGQQTFALGNPPLGVAFGADGLALVATTSDFLLFDPASGTTVDLISIPALTAKTLPVPPANFPPQITSASLGVSGDGLKMYGLTDTIEISYDVATKFISIIGYVSVPPQGPRVVSVNQNGSYYTSGWGLIDAQGHFVNEFRAPSGALNIGSTQFDSARGLIYAQIPDQILPVTQPPILQIVDADNLNVRERLRLPENLAGKSALRSDGSVMYSVSDSGVMVLPVGSMGQTSRVVASKEDLVFRGNFCDRTVATQHLTITDPGGGHTAFIISSKLDGVTVSPTFGVTPAVITVTVDPNVFQNQKGTVTGFLSIQSSQAANLPADIRVLINSREPDQRGTFVDIPGTLVDLLPDPTRNRFFVLRQDTNQVIVLDGSNYKQIGTLRTLNTPTQMAITFDQRYLLVGHDDAQAIAVFDLETLHSSAPIFSPFGHYPRSVASSAKAILAANRVAGPIHVIDRVDLNTRTATAFPTLGVFKNDINIDTKLVAPSNGSSILAVEADGNVLLYNANADTFTVSRKDTTALSGAYAASNYGEFVVGNSLLNDSLVPILQFESGTGQSSGFAFVDQVGFRTTAPAAIGGGPASSDPGIIQRIDAQSGASVSRATRMAEAPLLGITGGAFTRTIAPLYSRNNIVNLSVSGVTILPWDYDAAIAPPVLQQVLNSADFTAGVAPGGLISAFGENLSAVNLASQEIPLPTALAESCMTVNGLPIPILFVSPGQINAQLPFEVSGDTTLVLHTPGGVSNDFNLVILAGAPAVFRSGTIGPESAIPTIIRNENNQLVTDSNPIHKGDVIVIYLTGLGVTLPAATTGFPSPSNPLALALNKVKVDIGGVNLPILYAGLSPGEVGVYQINAIVPGAVPRGISVPLHITQESGGTTVVSLRVVE